MGHLLRPRHLRPTFDLIARLAGVLAVLALLVTLVGCGSSESGDPIAACQSAQTALPEITSGASRSQLAAEATAAAKVLSALTVRLANLPATSPNPEALANLRNAVAVASISIQEVGELVLQPGSGILDPITTQARGAFSQIQQAAAALGAPACAARALGSTLYSTLAAKAVAPAGVNLAFAAQTACTDISSAYGTTQIAIDKKAGVTQLARSTAVLRAALNDLADVTAPAGGRLRTALTQAIHILTSSTAQISDGANPARTSVLAFTRAKPLLDAGFRSAHITCSIPSP